MIFFSICISRFSKQYSLISMNELLSKENAIVCPVSEWLLQTEAYVAVMAHKPAVSLMEHLQVPNAFPTSPAGPITILYHVVATESKLRYHPRQLPFILQEFYPHPSHAASKLASCILSGKGLHGSRGDQGNTQVWCSSTALKEKRSAVRVDAELAPGHMDQRRPKLAPLPQVSKFPLPSASSYPHGKSAPKAIYYMVTANN